MPRTIGIAIASLWLACGAVTGARADGTPPPGPPPPAECRKVDRCTPTSDVLDGKSVQDRKTKTRHDTVKNSINNVR